MALRCIYSLPLHRFAWAATEHTFPSTFQPSFSHVCASSCVCVLCICKIQYTADISKSRGLPATGHQQYSRLDAAFRCWSSGRPSALQTRSATRWRQDSHHFNGSFDLRLHPCPSVITRTKMALSFYGISILITQGRTRLHVFHFVFLTTVKAKANLHQCDVIQLNVLCIFSRYSCVCHTWLHIDRRKKKQESISQGMNASVTRRQRTGDENCRWKGGEIDHKDMLAATTDMPERLGSSISRYPPTLLFLFISFYFFFTFFVNFFFFFPCPIVDDALTHSSNVKWVSLSSDPMFWNDVGLHTIRPFPTLGEDTRKKWEPKEMVKV